MNVYTVFSHPLRERILKILDDEHLIIYDALLSKLELEETGVLNYHLRKLSNFVEKNREFHLLTIAGQDAMHFIVVKDQICRASPLTSRRI
ncbi:MAG: hypothetical protein EAX87_12730 [Candidatus Thorarchaeota archaeon]|nr:hypothetical protein [Candidatus Thorarchaeota archaeon]